jgi:hypothetical protein
MRARASEMTRYGDHLKVLDFDALRSRGWCVAHLPVDELDLSEALHAIAMQLGTPAAFGGRELLHHLRPLSRHLARPRSLSAGHGMDSLPLHVDTAHWSIPCRYVVLGCLNPGAVQSPTRLLSLRRVVLGKAERRLLGTAVFKVRTGANSFYATVISPGRDYFRYDPGCMEATCSKGHEVLHLMSAENWAGSVQESEWSKHSVIVIDNWNVLHGRTSVTPPPTERTLIRMLVR